MLFFFAQIFQRDIYCAYKLNNVVNVPVVSRECGPDYPYDVDVSEMFHTWEHHKMENILTYRDKSFASKFTGGQSHKLLQKKCSFVVLASSNFVSWGNFRSFSSIILHWVYNYAFSL